MRADQQIKTRSCIPVVLLSSAEDLPMTPTKSWNWITWLGALLLACGVASPGFAQQKPSIVVIWGNDIGTWTLSAYSLGIMGTTPNIDRIAYKPRARTRPR
jgi:hypothetical protein